jgi:DNA-binding response OmpR family regulator
MKVLLVEDSRTQARFIAPYFDSQNAEILWALDAFDAWHLIVSHGDIDIIFLDANLPFVNAPLLIRKLKLEESTKNIPVIVMSSDEDAVECIHEGAVEFLKKPFKEQRVLDLLSIYIKK